MRKVVKRRRKEESHRTQGPDIGKRRAKSPSHVEEIEEGDTRAGIVMRPMVKRQDEGDGPPQLGQIDYRKDRQGDIWSSGEGHLPHTGVAGCEG